MIRTVILLSVILGLSACETIGGFGRDVSSAGRTVTATAQEVEEEIE